MSQKTLCLEKGNLCLRWQLVAETLLREWMGQKLCPQMTKELEERLVNSLSLFKIRMLIPFITQSPQDFPEGRTF